MPKRHVSRACAAAAAVRWNGGRCGNWALAEPLLRIIIMLVGASIMTALPTQSATAACSSRPVRIALDIGHSPRRYGATSARGAREYDFNRRFVEELLSKLAADDRFESFLISPTDHGVSLRRRVQLADGSGADAFLSIHHDSAQPHLLTSWRYGGRTLLKSDTISGFSLFISSRSPKYEQARSIATEIAKGWINDGHKPTLHHNAPIRGENRRLINRALGIYDAPFAVTKLKRVPSVLVEVGVLINPSEEIWLNSFSNRAKLQAGLIAALATVLCSNP